MSAKSKLFAVVRLCGRIIGRALMIAFAAAGARGTGPATPPEPFPPKRDEYRP